MIIPNKIKNFATENLLASETPTMCETPATVMMIRDTIKFASYEKEKVWHTKKYTIRPTVTAMTQSMINETMRPASTMTAMTAVPTPLK